MTDIEISNLLTTTRVAIEARVSATAVHAWVRKGLLIPAVQLSNGVRLFEPEDVARLISARQQRIQEVEDATR